MLGGGGGVGRGGTNLCVTPGQWLISVRHCLLVQEFSDELINIIIITRAVPESRGGLMVSTQVRQSEGSGLKSRSDRLRIFMV